MQSKLATRVVPTQPGGAGAQSSLPAELVAIAVEAAGELAVLLERCGNRADDVRIRGANAAFQAATGYGAAALQDRPLTLLVAATAVPPELLAALRTGVAQRTEMICHRRDGRSFWLGLHLVPMPQLGPGHFAMLGRDITQRRFVEAQHQAVESLLARVLMSIEAGVAMVGADGIVLMANPCIHRLTRVPADSLVGRDLLDFFAPADRARLIEPARTPARGWRRVHRCGDPGADQRHRGRGLDPCRRGRARRLAAVPRAHHHPGRPAREPDCTAAAGARAGRRPG